MEEDDKQVEISISRRRKSSTNHQTLDHNHKSIKPTKRIESNLVANPDPDPKSNPRPQIPPNQPKVKYRECQKNHAASSGGHVIDGCGEFMSSGEEGSPESFLCAACECHRSFHRKEIDGVYVVKFSSFNHQTRPVITHQATPIMMSFGGGGGGGAPAESSTEDLNKIHHCFNKGFDYHQFHQENNHHHHHHHPKKRFRTKFDKEQKEKMMEFAEKIKWRINKQEDEEVNRFCSEINVKRQVFKVWMHNHKQHQHQNHQNQQQKQQQEDESNKI